MSEQFKYEPNHFGSFSLSGPAVLHNNVVNDYTAEEIAELIKLKDFRLEFRKSDRGDAKISQYGFERHEVFFDLERCCQLDIEAVTIERLNRINPMEFQFPELLKEENAFTITRRYMFKKTIGKRAFKNRIKSALDGHILTPTGRTKINNAIAEMEWLHKNSPVSFYKATKKLKGS